MKNLTQQKKYIQGWRLNIASKASFLKSILSLLYYPICNNCDTVLKEDEILFCSQCFSKIERISLTDACPICLGKIENNQCKNCHNLDLHFKKIYSYFYFDKIIKNAVLNLKYNKRPKTGFALGQILGQKLLLENFDEKNSFLIPIPLNYKKYLKRGYNQSYFIAKGIADVTNIKFYNALKRNKNTQTQTKLSRLEREKNVENAFSIKEKFIKKIPSSSNIFIVDDVFTTGSTLNECAKVLRHKGYENIYGLTFARAWDGN